MDGRVKVSIIIPIYNTEKYLRQCLDSITNQTLSEIEIILVNDGSTDSSGKIALEYLKLYPFIQYIEQENQGQGAARNRALSIARGEYIYFLDSDDYIEHLALEELFNEAEVGNLDLILFDGESFVDEEFENKENYNFKYNRNTKYENIMDGHDFFVQLINDNNFLVSPCLYFIKKSIIERYNLKFYEGIIHEDELFTLELMLCCLRVKHIEKAYFHRRIRGGSTMTGKKYLKNFIGYSTVLFRIDDIYKQSKWKNNIVKNGVYIRMSDIYRITIRVSNNLQGQEHEDNKKTLKRIKNIGKEYNYFGIKAGAFFTNWYKVYKMLAWFKNKVIKIIK